MWLDKDRDAAGDKFNHIYTTLIKIFVRRGCLIAEELADITIDRVCHKIDEITADYVGDPALYFYGVAHHVWLEYIKKRPEPKPLPPYEPAEDQEARSTCLDRCLGKFNNKDHELILDYFQHEKRYKIDHRRKLAESLGISASALRVRIHRLIGDLRKCVHRCLKENPV